MTVVDRPTGATKAAKPRRRVVGVRSSLTAWLGRPLADFPLLTAIGLVMVLSASVPGEVAVGQSAYSVFQKQLTYVCVGAVLFWVALRLPLRQVRHLSTMAMLVCVLLLVLVLT